MCKLWTHVKFMSTCEITHGWMPQDTFDDKSTLVLVMAWCRQATSHYLSQCWPRLLLGHNELTASHIQDLLYALSPLSATWALWRSYEPSQGHPITCSEDLGVLPRARSAPVSCLLATGHPQPHSLMHILGTPHLDGWPISLWLFYITDWDC